MGDFYEGRAGSCWTCKYFVQNESDYCNGICVRKAPEKIDENLGGSITGAPTGYTCWPNVNEPDEGFCDSFEQATVAPPAVIPDPKPVP